MAKTIIDLPGSTLIEVVAIKEGKVPVKKIMTIEESNFLERKDGWRYIRYQIGFSSY